MTVRVLIASPLEPRLVERIAAVDGRLDVVYRPELLGTPRYAGDHTPPVQRSDAQEAEWNQLLASAEVMFDVDRPNARAGLRERAPALRWVQASSSGVGEWIKRLGLLDAPVQVTNAAGIHAGLGQVGREIARVSKALGMRVIGMRRTAGAVEGVDEVFGRDGLHALLEQSDYVVLMAPYTSETDTLLDAHAIGRMKHGAVLINVARGNLLDEAALLDALHSGRLAGAAQDVFRTEPLPADSPFWELPNVLITPHSMSTAIGENELLVDLFCDNLRRYLDGQPLRNLVDKARGY